MNFLFGFIMGVFALIGYGAFRALRSDGWDDSNMLNWLRLLSQIYIHPEDFAQLYYFDIDNELNEVTGVVRAFPYLGQDEFESVVRSRPPGYYRDKFKNK